MDEKGVYVYAICRDPCVGLSGLAGVSGAVVRAIVTEGFCAYVSTVSMAEYGEEPVHRNLERIEWLERAARQHDAVVEAVSREVAVVPVRLVTVYRDDAHVAEVLRERRDEIAQIIDHVTGRQEWGVKAYVDREGPASSAQNVARSSSPAGAADAGGAAPADGTDRPSTDLPGTEFLRRRSAQLRSREVARTDAAALADDLHDYLIRLAVDSCRHPPQDPQLTRRADAMILNGAYLVEASQAEDFAVAVDAAQRPGVTIELTGPWAPYSFTDVEVGAAPGEAVT